MYPGTYTYNHYDVSVSVFKCYLGSEFSELNRPSLDNESRNLLILTKMTENRDRQRKSTTNVMSTFTANSLKPRDESAT